MSLEQLFAEKEGIFEVDMGIQHHFSNGVYAKQMHFPAGYSALGHKHEFSHLSILAKGRVIVKTDEYNKEYIAPACIEIAKGVHHMITALEDCVWYCIHATDETDPEKVDEVLIGKD